ncbi:MAG TPA: HDOD domain-containing protein [Spirochaetota bacterium]|nr:HDOD domain-containing protein [Spirochaetota bacterium]
MNIPQLIAHFDKNEPVSISFYYPNEAISRTLNAMLAAILSKNDQIYLLDMMITILREIIVNATKANAKRIYFKKLNLDINDPQSYTTGIEHFKKDIVGQLDTLENELKNSNLKVTLSICKEDKGVTFIITNPAAIHSEELNRIKTRIEKAKEYLDFTQAYEDVYDDTEGAGLGIVLVILLLKNAGIDPSNYNIGTDGKVTRVVLSLPLQLRPEAITTKIKQQIINAIQGIPTFPEHILVLLQLCRNKEVEIKDITMTLLHDPALSTDVLKLANSAGFVPSKRVNNLSEAVMTIGLKNLESLLITISARKILDDRFQKFEQIWEHCNRVASYARTIASKYKMNAIIEQVSLCGLLHDLGKIVLLSVDLDVTQWIAKLVSDRRIRTSTVMEEISIGISHSGIGELIASKWQLPEYLIEAIRHHHTPLSTDSRFKDIVYITYLANLLCGVESRRYFYYYCDDEVSRYFTLESQSDFENLGKLCQDIYNKLK